jgi:hypothetical protein
MLQELQVQRLQCNPAPAVMPFISSNKKRQDFFSFFWKKKKQQPKLESRRSKQHPNMVVQQP